MLYEGSRFQITDNDPMSALTPTLIKINCPAQGQGSVPSHAIAVWSWGAPQADHLVVCVHGLTRQGRDFDVLAQQLLDRDPTLCVLCPDVVGRGQSDWLSEASSYQIPVYAADMMHWLSARHARQAIRRLDWVGTSMGGVIGLVLAAQPENARNFPVHRLVLNDVGPSLPWPFVERLKTYVGVPQVFESPEQAAQMLRQQSPGFGPHSDADWLNLCRPMLKPGPAGGWVLHYDPAIVEPIRRLTPEAFAQGETLLWTLYDQITCPTLVLRGCDSDVLLPETARSMTQRGPAATLIEFPNVGHAPTLVDRTQTTPLLDWLLS